MDPRRRAPGSLVGSTLHFPEPSLLTLSKVSRCPSTNPVPMATADGVRFRTRLVPHIGAVREVKKRARHSSILPIRLVPVLFE
jgi:hypothetical protein